MTLKSVKEILARAMTDKEFRVKLLDKTTAEEAMRNYEKELTEEEKGCLAELTPEKLEDYSATTDIITSSDIRI
ncbi:MAG: hypothetical protein ABID38_05340 [Candidatus Diapherotrites archaeon]